MLLVDEVQTGVGRTGSLFAFQQYGILPDVASFAKGIAGGLPMSGILANEKCRDVLGPGTHATTFGANPVCAAAGLVVQETLSDAFLEDVQAKGTYLRNQIEALDLPCFGATRGLGLMIGIEVRDGFSNKEIANKLIENGLLVLTADDYFGKTGQPLTLKDQALADFAAKAGPLLLIVDPLQSFLPSDVEMASRNQMRSALLPLRAIAAKQGCAVLIVMHSNKKQGVSGRARLADSSDIWDMARSVLMMGRAKNDGKIYLSHEKNSYARPQQTVLLHIDDVEVEGVKTARAVFDGYTDKKDADFIEERRVRTAETRQDTRSAILNVLSESRLGSMPSNELRAAVLREVGCSDSTYNRVYSELVKSGEIAKHQINQGGNVRSWFTAMPYRGETSDKVAKL